MKSVRHQLLERFPPPPRATEPDQQVGHALYYMLWDLDEPDISVDGWHFFKVTHENDSSLDAVGLMWLLPHDSMPMLLHVDATESGLSWQARASLKDDGWRSLSPKKKWNNVYLFANGDLPEPPWSWDRTYAGLLPRVEA